MTQLTVLSKAEVYIFKGRGVFIDVYIADDKIVTSGATSLADINLRRTYRAIDSVATGRIPSLFCDSSNPPTAAAPYLFCAERHHNDWSRVLKFLLLMYPIRVWSQRMCFYAKWS